MATQDEIILELQKRGVFDDPKNKPIVDELQKRGLVLPKATSPIATPKPPITAENVINTAAKAGGAMLRSAFPGPALLGEAAGQFISDPQRALEAAPAIAGGFGATAGLPGIAAGAAAGKGIEVGGKAALKAVGYPVRSADVSIGLPGLIGFTVPSPKNEVLKPIAQVATETAAQTLGAGSVTGALRGAKEILPKISRLPEEAITRVVQKTNLLEENPFGKTAVEDVAKEAQTATTTFSSKIKSVYDRVMRRLKNVKVDATEVVKAADSLASQAETVDAPQAVRAIQHVKKTLEKSKTIGDPLLGQEGKVLVKPKELHEMRMVLDEALSEAKNFKKESGTREVVALRKLVDAPLKKIDAIAKVDAKYEQVAKDVGDLKSILGVQPMEKPGAAALNTKKKIETLIKNYYEKSGNVEIRELERILKDVPKSEAILERIRDLAANAKIRGTFKAGEKESDELFGALKALVRGPLATRGVLRTINAEKSLRVLPSSLRGPNEK